MFLVSDYMNLWSNVLSKRHWTGQATWVNEEADAEEADGSKSSVDHDGLYWLTKTRPSKHDVIRRGDQAADSQLSWELLLLKKLQDVDLCKEEPSFICSDLCPGKSQDLAEVSVDVAAEELSFFLERLVSARACLGADLGFARADKAWEGLEDVGLGGGCATIK